MTSSSPDVVVFGSIVQDLVCYSSALPKPGETILGSRFATGSGGKGANQAVAAARLGANVALVAKVGSDGFGAQNTENLSKSGVDVSRVGVVDDVSTAVASITVTDGGENTIVVVLGANERMSAEDADANAELISRAKILLCQSEIPQQATRRAFEVARRNGVRTLFNAAPADPSVDPSILQVVDIICTNENETECLTSIKTDTVEDAKRAARAMLAMGPSVALVTLGANGVVLATTTTTTTSSEAAEHVEHIDAPRVNAIDTTGAGDCFCGTLAYFLARRSDLSLREAVRRSIVVATQSVTRPGTQASYAAKNELDEKLFE